MLARATRCLRLVVAASLLLGASVEAGPLVLEESARLLSPDSGFTLNGPVAVDGDFLIAIASRSDLQQGYLYRRGYLFRHAASGHWDLVRTLFTDQSDFIIGPPAVSVAMGEGIAAISHADIGGASTRLRVFERSGADYVEVPAIGTPDASDLEISGGTILASSGGCSWDAETFRRNSAGTWVKVGGSTGIFRGCDDEFEGGDVALSGGLFLVGNPQSDDVNAFPPQAQLFAGVEGTPSEQVLLHPNGSLEFADRVALEGRVAVVSASATGGDYVFTRSETSFDWNYENILWPDDAFAAGAAGYLELEGGLLLRSRAQDDGAVGIFRRLSPFAWEYSAKLVPSVGRLSRGSADRSGNRIVASGSDAAYVWDLPTNFSQPARRQDDFQQGNGVDWTPQPGSDFAVVTGTDSLVYRQRSLAGNATALLNSPAWGNQSIQADLKPLEFQAADRWLGLTVRYVDANNYYYVTLRQSNVLQLRRLVNGAFVTLASAPLTVTLGRTYNVRLEAIGATLRVYVDGVPMLRARDHSHAAGQVGLITYRTRADYDNVVASPNLRTTLLGDDFEGTNSWWTTQGMGQWSFVTDGTSRVYQQSSLSDGAHAFTGVPTTTDQIIHARAKATAFGTGAGRWFGLMARYQDASNYYYITLRNDNTVSLRKLVNGAIFVLDTAPLAVTANTWYDLRFEAVGNKLRAAVNGRTLLEATDDDYLSGSYGIAMYKAATRVDNFYVVQP